MPSVLKCHKIYKREKFWVSSWKLGCCW